MRIFVTGGTGFIGRALIPELRRGGHRVLLLVRHLPRGVAQKNTKSGVSYIRGDLSRVPRWISAVRRFKPHAAVHLAWEGIPDFSARMSLKNLSNGLELFSALADIGCPKVVAVGSCLEYGAHEGRIREDAALAAWNAFSAAKAALQRMGVEIAREHKQRFVWLRIFYVYGPGQKDSSLIPSLIRSFEKGREPAILNPRRAHDFVYVGDVARAIALLLKKSPRSSPAVYNIGSGKLTSVAEIAGRVAGHYNVKMMNTKRQTRLRGLYADISKMKREFGWRPIVSMREGIEKTLRALA